MGAHGQMAEHFLIGAFVGFGKLEMAIELQAAAELIAIKEQQMLES
jgi:hypothetical protein